MQNENAGKTVEQIAAEKYPFDSRKLQSNDELFVVDRINRNATLQRLGFIDGYTTAQQSQPMWREIEYGVKYHNVILKKGNETQVVLACYGQDVQVMGYTHYLSSEDLLRLPTEKK